MSMVSPEQQAAARAMKLYKPGKSAKPGKIQRHFAALAVRAIPARRTAMLRMHELMAQLRYMRQLDVQRARRLCRGPGSGRGLRFAWWNALVGRMSALFGVQKPQPRLEASFMKLMRQLKQLYWQLSATLIPVPILSAVGGGSATSAAGSFHGCDPPGGEITGNVKTHAAVESMTKSLTQKLRTGAAIGLASLALGATAPKAQADLIIPYDSGNLSSTTPSGSGYLGINYRQIIEEIDTNGDNIMDSYKSSLSILNSSQNNVGGETGGAYFVLSMNADLAGRGATDMTNYWANKGSTWNYETTGEDISQMILTEGWSMAPTDSDTFYYTISKDKVLGWENVGASMGANAGSVSFDFHAPVAIPEATSMGALLAGAAAMLVARRMTREP